MDFVHGLLRLAAQQQDIKDQNGLERRPNYALFAHKTHYTKKLTFCNRFFALIFYISSSLPSCRLIPNEDEKGMPNSLIKAFSLFSGFEAFFTFFPPHNAIVLI